MLLPTKSIPADQAMLTIGAQILIQLDSPASISATWDRLLDWRTKNRMPSALPFWWFALTLDFLFAVNAIDLSGGELRRNSRATRAD